MQYKGEAGRGGIAQGNQLRPIAGFRGDGRTAQIKAAMQALALCLARDFEEIAIMMTSGNPPVMQRRICFAQGNHLPGEVEQGGRIGILRVYRTLAVFFAHGQPGGGTAKTGGIIACPRHRGAGTVAAECERPIGDGFWIVQLIKGDIDLR